MSAVRFLLLLWGAASTAASDAEGAASCSNPAVGGGGCQAELSTGRGPALTGDHLLLQLGGKASAVVDEHRAGEASESRRRRRRRRSSPSASGQASPQGASAAASVPAGSVSLSTFFWNVHWECSLAARGASHACKSKVGRRFVELARAAKAEVVASVELSDGNSRPASLVKFGLKGWTQVDGPCSSGHSGDAAALAFAPTWQVQASDGGCLRHDGDTRAFAVARVVPPSPVEGCPSLCVVAIHAPHSSIDKGKDAVARVCGDAAQHCAVAMGDWNTPAHGVGRLWSHLIGGAAPNLAYPDERTCCFPESHHYGVFDHVATNVPGAAHVGHKVHPYQILEENPRKQHKAVSVHLSLPGAK